MRRARPTYSAGPNVTDIRPPPSPHLLTYKFERAGAAVDSYVPEADRDPLETREWIDSLKSVVDHEGRERARFLLERTIEDGRRQGVAPVLPLNTDYVNTIRLEEQPDFPGDKELESRISRIIRWNAAV